MTKSKLLSKNETTVQFTLRLPADLREQIEAEAERNRRTVNSEITVAIERYLERK